MSKMKHWDEVEIPSSGDLSVGRAGGGRRAPLPTPPEASGVPVEAQGIARPALLVGRQPAARAVE
jgi:hypothetical protein